MTSSSTPTSAIVKTAQGAVRGTQEVGISVFRGIPYAEPPVGKLRFRPPVVRQRWAGARDATTFGEIVPQTDEAAGAFDRMLLRDGVPQGDDCLNLNVWTPDPGQTGLPVLVWIHGGSFLWGAGSNPVYDGATFARDGIVTVTINYRLGASGFLYIGGRSGSGNFALLDQIAALRWVQDNIAAFGGDPARVTVAGESAGALCIGQLLAAPAARGLFRRAIMQSGGTHSHIGTEAASLVADEVLARLGVRMTDDDAIASITSPQLLAAQMAAQPRATEVASNGVVSFDLLANRFVIFGPTSGTDVVPERALLSIGRGVAKDIDLLVGGNADEATFWIQSAEAAQGLVDVIEQVAGLVFSPSGRSGSEVLEHYRISRGKTDRAGRGGARRLGRAAGGRQHWPSGISRRQPRSEREQNPETPGPRRCPRKRQLDWGLLRGAARNASGFQVCC